MSDEEIKLTELLLKIKDIKLLKELESAIDSYGTQKYSEGYDEAERNSDNSF